MRKQVPDSVAAHGGRAARFALVGVLNTIVDVLVYWGLVALSLHPVLANLGAFIVANVQSYFINARFTFSTNGKAAAISPAGYLKYALSHSFSLIASTAIIALAAPRIGALPAKLIAVGLTFFVNYLASAFLVFRPAPAKETARRHPPETAD